MHLEGGKILSEKLNTWRKGWSDRFRNAQEMIFSCTFCAKDCSHSYCCPLKQLWLLNELVKKTNMDCNYKSAFLVRIETYWQGETDTLHSGPHQYDTFCKMIIKDEMGRCSLACVLFRIEFTQLRFMYVTDLWRHYDVSIGGWSFWWLYHFLL